LIVPDSLDVIQFDEAEMDRLGWVRKEPVAIDPTKRKTALMQKGFILDEVDKTWKRGRDGSIITIKAVGDLEEVKFQHFLDKGSPFPIVSPSE